MHNSRLAMAMNTPQVEVVDITDDRPLAVRRKRRISTGLVDPVDIPKLEPSVEVEESSREAPKTPTKSKKRVRFSDPGPELSAPSTSTGLTPYLKRTTFTPRAQGPSTPRLLAAGTRRLSLPVQLSTSLPSPSLSPSPGPFSGEFQFAPLRQVLDNRLKRRLRRNNLSGEINDIDEEKKSKRKLEQEIQSLKDELAVAKQSGKEHSDGSDGEAAGAERIRELEQQLVELRREMRERSTTAEPVAGSDDLPDTVSSPMEIFVDNADEDFIATNFDDNGALQDQTPVGVLQPVNEAGTQVALPSPTHTETFRFARISLEYLFPGEIALGLIPEDPKPLLDVMLDRMRTLKAQAFMAEGSLKATETQESNLRNQFNAVLAQLDRARVYADDLSKRHSNEKTRADNAQARVSMLETSLQNTSSKATDLARDVDEKERSIGKLQDALESYRIEVGKLEMLVTRSEGEHDTAISQLRSEMDEAVADLECHVAAETRGRREAEQEVQERNVRIKELKVREQELQAAVNEKQEVIRETEAVFAEERTGREREVGGLNVTIGQLSTDLSECKAKVAAAEEKQQLLMRKLQEERDAGLRAVEAVQTELASCTEKAEGVKIAHVKDVQMRGAEVTEHKGLLTPVSVTRFRDVEGYVEFRRGKKGKRPDSGIGVLEEDEDEDMIMADDL
ncbi:hypothetical protein HO173_009747 [Letharia columbiana]|uniref:Uncharacterized protein n=1 Tax=Letharia columbiana TaxID=112416 RepID=A0A8H6FNR3_9LECA|nr:uncharacterized protein HO173_009747 [Letharia columbiana]KAF6231910.1 hypothetical protein HO173_009747 [Letharia columbiana]